MCVLAGLLSFQILGSSLKVLGWEVKTSVFCCVPIVTNLVF